MIYTREACSKWFRVAGQDDEHDCLTGPEQQANAANRIQPVKSRAELSRPGTATTGTGAAVFQHPVFRLIGPPGRMRKTARRRPKHQVVMVGHQAIRQHLRAKMFER